MPARETKGGAGAALARPEAAGPGGSPARQGSPAQEPPRRPALVPLAGLDRQNNAFILQVSLRYRAKCSKI